MAASSAFKVQCASCEAMVTIRDPALIGKKVVCPRCKYPFVVEKPEEKPEAEEPGDESSDPPKAKKKPTKPVEDAADPKAKKKTKPAGKKLSRNMVIGLSLAGVALVVLLAAGGYAIFGKKKALPPLVQAPPGNSGKGDPELDGDGKGGEKDPKKDPGKKPPVVTPVEVPMTRLAELTNLLPEDSQSVFAFKVADYANSTFGNAVFQALSSFDNKLKKNLGFTIGEMDALYRADNFKDQSSITIVRFAKDHGGIAALKGPLALLGKEDGDRAGLYEVRKSQSLLHNLPRVSLGVPSPVLMAGPVKHKMYLAVLDKQTLIFGVEKQVAAAHTAALKGVPSKQRYAKVAGPVRAMLQRMENEQPASTAKTLLWSATEIGARGFTDYFALGNLSVRPFWDISHLFRDQITGVDVFGTALSSDGQKKFSYLNAFACSKTSADMVEETLKDKIAPELLSFQEKLLKQRIKPPQDGAGEDKPVEGKKPGAAGSQLTIERDNGTVLLGLQLALDPRATDRINAGLRILATGLKAELDAPSAVERRAALTLAIKAFDEKGLMVHPQFEKPGLPNLVMGPKEFPPAAFPRPAGTPRSATAPHQRVSWMTALLPYLDYKPLYESIDFTSSWKDPSNWLAARTLVPQFLDPTYPLSSRFVFHPDLPFDAAGTHFVGLAGVGPDAAEYDSANPKRGIFGYHRGFSFKAFGKERNASNTILMVRVPWNGPAGVTPWLAGGGSTVRTVPEERSLEPFLSGDPKGERDTYLLMVDGSVRHVRQSANDKNGMSDAVFKALATVNAPLPGDWEANAPLADQDKKK